MPIVFSYLAPGRIIGDYLYPGPVGGRKLGGNVTGVTLTIDVASTVVLALRLHPDSNHVAVITNKSAWERYWLCVLQAELKPYSRKVKEIDFVGLPYGQILDKVTALPPRTIVIFTIIPQDSIQPMVGPYDIVETIGKRLPTYCIFPKLCLNHGGIGGTDYDEREQTVLTAELASQVLFGEHPDDEGRLR